jgi:hypothetical protein
MTDKELLFQVLKREIDNILGSINPAFRMFTPTITASIINFINPYVDAFMSPDGDRLNTKAAAGYLKEETSRKIEDFLNKFESESHNGKM